MYDTARRVALVKSQIFLKNFAFWVRVFSIFCTYISEGVFKPHFRKTRKEVQTNMYDTARRVALVKQRVRENTRRRQRREAISLSAVVYAAVRGADAGGGARAHRAGDRPPHGACSARCCCGRTRAAMCW